MFCKLSLLALVTPLVSALTIQVPENPTSGGVITIKWSSAQNDPDTWSFELTNPTFNQAFAIANNVNPTAGQLTLTLPIVPVGGDYTLEAVNIGNINDVFAATPNFSIGAATSASVTSASSTSSGTTSKASSSSTGSSSSLTTPASSSTPSVTSNIVSNTDTSSSSSTSAGTGAPAGSTPFSGALSSRLGASPAGGIAAVLLSVVAGAAMIAL